MIAAEAGGKKYPDSVSLSHRVRMSSFRPSIDVPYRPLRMKTPTSSDLPPGEFDRNKARALILAGVAPHRGRGSTTRPWNRTIPVLSSTT
jgi:hypothetical protein